MTDYIIKRLRSVDFTGDRMLHASQVTEVVWNAADEIERLRRERDEARRMLCQFESRLDFEYGNIDPSRFGPAVLAASRGWDCFKEATQ
jgi:hypothetical protein